MAIDAIAEASWHTVVPTALGNLTLVRDANALLGLYNPHHWYMARREPLGPLSKHGFEDVIEQLAEYLAGQRRDFDLPLATRGSGFQDRVWSLVRKVSYGDTTTYGDLAGRLGDEVTAQEVGAAVARNPLYACSSRATGLSGGAAS